MKKTNKAELRSLCCGATTMSAQGKSIYCSKCGGICKTMNPELARIERKLDWIIIKNQLDYFANIGMHAGQEQRDRCRKNIEKLKKQMPDLSDIGLKCVP